MGSHAVGDAAVLPEVAPKSPGDGSPDVNQQRSYAAFPYDKFEAMFYKLAEEMGLPAQSDGLDLKGALTKLFNSIPETAKPRGKTAPHIHRGLLQKMLAAKMERQNAGQEFDIGALMQEFSKAMKHLQDFSPDKSASPTDALQQLAQLTNSWVSPEGMAGMKKYMEHAAEVLKEFLPALHTEEEL